MCSSDLIEFLEFFNINRASNFLILIEFLIEFMGKLVLENHLSRQIYLIYIFIQSFPKPMIWFMGILIKRKKPFLVALLLLQHALAKLKKNWVKLNPNKAAGVDSIPARLLKCVANELANPSLGYLI